MPFILSRRHKVFTPSLLAARLLSLDQLGDLEHGTTPHSMSWQHLQALLVPCPCFLDILLSFTFSVVALVILDDHGLETFTRRWQRPADHSTSQGTSLFHHALGHQADDKIPPGVRDGRKRVREPHSPYLSCQW